MKISKIFTPVLISLILFHSMRLPDVQACGPSYWPYEGARFNELIPPNITFLFSDLGKDFYLDEYSFKSHWNRDSADQTIDKAATDKSINLQEWKAHVGNSVETDAIEEAVYHFSKYDFESVRDRIQTGTTVKDNEFIIYILKNRKNDLLDYIIYAKLCEPYATIKSDDPWGKQTYNKEHNAEEMQRIIEQGLNQANNVSDDFLKLRYGYHIVRMAHLAKKYPECIQYYKQFSGFQPSSLYNYKMMRYYAGALKRLEQYPQYLYCTSLIFDQSAQLKNRALDDFFLAEPAVWEDTIRLIGNNHRRATLWLMRALKNNRRIDLKPLEMVSRLEPKSSRLTFLLNYTVNTIEKLFLQPEYFFPTDNPVLIGKNYIEDALAIIENVDIEQARNPELWHLSAGYLNMLLGEYNQAEQYLSKAYNLRSDDAKFTKQIELIRFLSRLKRADSVSPALEDQAISLIQWFHDDEGGTNFLSIKSSFMLLMAQKYLNAGNMVKGYCFLNMSGYWDIAQIFITDCCSDSVLNQIKSYINMNDKRTFDKLITAGLIYPDDYINYYQGSRALNEGRFRDALHFLGMTPLSGNRRDISTLFDASVISPGNGRVDRSKLADFTRYEFVKRVCSLLDEAERNPGQAGASYFKIANGFAHLRRYGYDGGSTRLYQYANYSEIYVQDNPSNDRSIFKPFYYWKDTSSHPFYVKELMDILNRKRSTVPTESILNFDYIYYNKALEVTEDKELAAQCLFLSTLADMRIKKFEDYRNTRYDGIMATHRDSFKKMADEFSDTNYYSEVIKECSYLRDYVNSTQN